MFCIVTDTDAVAPTRIDDSTFCETNAAACAGMLKEFELVALCRLALTTVIGPLAAPAGTEKVMAVSDHVVGVIMTPLSWRLPMPWPLPKFVPETVTGVPMGPLVGVNPVIVTGG